MHSIYLENRGSSGFVLREFPVQSQYAAVSVIVLEYMNGDGKKDTLLAGNNSWTRLKFGSLDANHGIVFLGDGKDNFKYFHNCKAGYHCRETLKAFNLLITAKTWKSCRDK